MKILKKTRYTLCYSKLFAELNLKNSLEIIKNKTIKTIIIRLPVVVFKSKKI